MSHLANVLQVDAPDPAPPPPLPLLRLVELPLEDGEEAGDPVVQPAGGLPAQPMAGIGATWYADKNGMLVEGMFNEKDTGGRNI